MGISSSSITHRPTLNFTASLNTIKTEKKAANNNTMKPSLLVDALKKKLPGYKTKDNTSKDSKNNSQTGTKAELEVIERKSRSGSKLSKASGNRSRTNSMNYALGGI